MDTVTHFALGGALAAAVLGTRIGARRAVLWGGAVANLPDLDVLIDRGDALHDMILHRAETHALLWLALAAPVLAFGIVSLHRERARFVRWWLALWAALWSHALLDAMTIYGTRLALPFSDYTFGVGSVFVIDPLVTLPLLVGVGWLAITNGRPRARRAHRIGLALAAAYLLWGVAAQRWAVRTAQRSLATAGIAVDGLLACPDPLQGLLWRIVATTPDELLEAHWSVFDGAAPLEWMHVARGAEYYAALQDEPEVAELAAFCHGFFKLWRDGDTIYMADARMGIEPYYMFTFAVAHVGSPQVAPVPPTRRRVPVDVARALPWLWHRMWGERVAPPR